MTVQELIDLLENYNPNADVFFVYQYGDFWNTLVANSPEAVEQGKVAWSDYHLTYKVMDECENYEKDELDAFKEGILIR